MKSRADYYDVNAQKIVKFSLTKGIETEDYDLKAYREEKQRRIMEKIEADKKVAMI